MATNIQTLYDKRARVLAEMEDLKNSVKEGWTKDQTDKFDRMDADFNAITKEIGVENKLREYKKDLDSAEGEAVVASPVAVDKKLAYKEAFGKMIRNGYHNLNDKDRDALKFQPVGAAEQSRATGADGEYTVPEDFSGEVYRVMKYFSGWDACRVITTSTGRDLPWPTNDDTSNAGYLIAENVSAETSATKLTFGVKTLGAYQYTSGMIQVPNVLLQDEGVNLDGFIAERLGTRLGRILNTHVTTGTGTNQPQGFASLQGTTASQGKVAAADTEFTVGELIDLMHSVDRSYRASAKAGWQFHDTTLGYIKKLQTTGTYDGPLWQPSLRDGDPDKLLGHQYWVNNDVQALTNGLPTADDRLVYFGDFNAHVVRIVNGVSIKRALERYIEKDQTGFIGFMRFDAELMDTSAIKYLRQLNT